MSEKVLRQKVESIEAEHLKHSFAVKAIGWNKIGHRVDSGRPIHETRIRPRLVDHTIAASANPIRFPFRALVGNFQY
jgi:hypothetical protein